MFCVRPERAARCVPFDVLLAILHIYIVRIQANRNDFQPLPRSYSSVALPQREEPLHEKYHTAEVRVESRSHIAKKAAGLPALHTQTYQGRHRRMGAYVILASRRYRLFLLVPRHGLSTA